MPQRSNKTSKAHAPQAHGPGDSVATLAPSDAAAAERLLATLADVAIDQMLAPAPRRAPISRPRPVAVDPDDVRLSPEEQAALGTGPLADPGVENPPQGLWADGGDDADHFGAAADAQLSAMPTDEELEALLLLESEEDATTAPPPRRPAPAGRQAAPAMTDAAAELAAELDEELAPRARPLEPTLPSRGPSEDWEEEDEVDAIQAEGAIEARGAVNIEEPAVHSHSALGLTGQAATATGMQEPREVAAAAWWLLPLVWLNAPLAGAPQSLRQTIGKLAVLTLLNATAALVYVLLIRR